MQDGIILIDKPAGMTSFGVVARLKRVLSSEYHKKIKVGHTGTLDPFATGLMIIVTGKECKNASQYSKLDKVYEATFFLGTRSTTGDPEGDLTSTKPDPIPPSRDEVEKIIHGFLGKITQTPPIFSAIKINGRRAYQLARSGEDVEMPTRTVNIKSLEILKYDYPELKVRADVSSGTYIRSLAVDIGEALGTGAYCMELRRLSIDTYSVKSAKLLSDFGIQD